MGTFAATLVTAGTAFSFNVSAEDPFANIATSYAGTIHFLTSDANSQVVLPPNSSLTAGQGTFNATLVTAGNQTIAVGDTLASSITGTSNFIRVGPRTATHFVVSAPATALTGTPLSFTVTAEDTFNNTASAYSGTVRFSSSDSSALVALPTPGRLTNGKGTFTATLVTQGNQTITATDRANNSITGTSNVIHVTTATIAFVNALYQDVLNRAPDSGGLNFWVGVLNNGVPQPLVVQGFWNSAEHRTLEVEGYYNTFLHRPADPLGLATWVAQLEAGMSETQVLLAILSSPEFNLQHPGADPLIDELFFDVLNRPAQPADLTAWEHVYTEPLVGSRIGVIAGIVNSAEAFQDTLNIYYMQYLGRMPDLRGDTAWLSALESGVLAPGAVALAILESSEFYSHATGLS
jgi:hypothetical protein